MIWKNITKSAVQRDFFKWKGWNLWKIKCGLRCTTLKLQKKESGNRGNIFKVGSLDLFQKGVCGDNPTPKKQFVNSNGVSNNSTQFSQSPLREYQIVPRVQYPNITLIFSHKNYFGCQLQAQMRILSVLLTDSLSIDQNTIIRFD